MTFDSLVRRLINVVQSPRTVTAVMGKVSLRTKVALAFVVVGLIFVASQALLRLLRYIWIERGLRKAVKKYYLKVALGALLITGALDLFNVVKEHNKFFSAIHFIYMFYLKLIIYATITQGKLEFCFFYICCLTPQETVSHTGDSSHNNE